MKNMERKYDFFFMDKPIKEKAFLNKITVITYKL